ncbi:N-acetylglucosamine kinase [Streptosporangium sp. NPDC001559]|uniref:N-acetylglucosamine kinase n=1 Tax=Streptosporangium sp. NPDC001559 TaxID=3366187 RepID=UPI0036E4B486
MDLVLGIDAGGTSSRCAVRTLHGDPVGYGRSGGGNPTAHGAAVARSNLASAVRQALGAHDPASVRAAVAGVAGSSASPDDLTELWAALGLGVSPRVVGDVEIAFSAGTAAPSGTVLISGTGAIAAAITDRSITAVSDGYGWLLGDTGSGFWLGRQAVGSVLDTLRHGTPPYGTLAETVVERLLGAVGAPLGPDRVNEVIRAVHARAPLALAELAPLVTAAAEAGDATATSLVTRAATHLADTVAKVRAPGDTGPIVLAGSVLTGSGPLGHAVGDRLARRWNAPVTTAGDAACAAAWLAARDLVSDPAALHARIMRT